MTEQEPVEFILTRSDVQTKEDMVRMVREYHDTLTQGQFEQYKQALTEHKEFLEEICNIDTNDDDTVLLSRVFAAEKYHFRVTHLMVKHMQPAAAYLVEQLQILQIKAHDMCIEDIRQLFDFEHTIHAYYKDEKKGGFAVKFSTSAVDACNIAVYIIDMPITHCVFDQLCTAGLHSYVNHVADSDTAKNMRITCHKQGCQLETWALDSAGMVDTYPDCIFGHWYVGRRKDASYHSTSLFHDDAEKHAFVSRMLIDEANKMEKRISTLEPELRIYTKLYDDIVADKDTCTTHVVLFPGLEFEVGVALDALNEVNYTMAKIHLMMSHAIEPLRVAKVNLDAFSYAQVGGPFCISVYRCGFGGLFECGITNLPADMTTFYWTSLYERLATALSTKMTNGGDIFSTPTFESLSKMRDYASRRDYIEAYEYALMSADPNEG